MGEFKKEKKTVPEEFDDKDLGECTDANDCGEGIPMYAKFEREDWILLEWSYELHLLAHGFKHDVDDPERPAIPEDHMGHYYNLYLGKNYNAKNLGCKDLAGVVELLPEAVTLSGGKLLAPALPEDAQIVQFVRFTEEARRDRTRRIEAGDESCILNIPKAPVATAESSAKSNDGSGRVRFGKSGGKAKGKKRPAERQSEMESEPKVARREEPKGRKGDGKRKRDREERPVRHEEPRARKGDSKGKRDREERPVRHEEPRGRKGDSKGKREREERPVRHEEPRGRKGEGKKGGRDDRYGQDDRNDRDDRHGRDDRSSRYDEPKGRKGDSKGYKDRDSGKSKGKAYKDRDSDKGGKSKGKGKSKTDAKGNIIS